MSQGTTAQGSGVLGGIPAKLWALIMKYGPTVVKWLIDSGIIKLPTGVTLPPLNFNKIPAIGSAEQQALDIDVTYFPMAHANLLNQHMHQVLNDVP